MRNKMAYKNNLIAVRSVEKPSDAPAVPVLFPVVAFMPIPRSRSPSEMFDPEFISIDSASLKAMFSVLSQATIVT